MGDNRDMKFKQGSICETRKGPNRPPIRRGIEYLAYANVLENKNRYFWPIWQLRVF